MTNPVIAVDEIPQDGEKYLPVKIVKEDGRSAISSGCQMIEGSRQLDS